MTLLSVHMAITDDMDTGQMLTYLLMSLLPLLLPPSYTYHLSTGVLSANSSGLRPVQDSVGDLACPLIPVGMAHIIGRYNLATGNTL
jgi:hypothetical protein